MHSINDSNDTDWLNTSFTEIEDPIMQKSKDDMQETKKRSDLIQLEWMSKVDLLQIKIHADNIFPFKILQNNYLKKAIENFEYENQRYKMYACMLL